jgi:hypothetical protein
MTRQSHVVSFVWANRQLVASLANREFVKAKGDQIPHNILTFHALAGYHDSIVLLRKRDENKRLRTVIITCNPYP